MTVGESKTWTADNAACEGWLIRVTVTVDGRPFAFYDRGTFAATRSESLRLYRCHSRKEMLHILLTSLPTEEAREQLRHAAGRHVKAEPVRVRVSVVPNAGPAPTREAA